jgi:AraC family transcriptional regulator
METQHRQAATLHQGLFELPGYRGAASAPMRLTLAPPHRRAQLVRIFGFQATGVTESMHDFAGYDVLTTNMSSGGHYAWRNGSRWKEAPLRRGWVSFVPFGHQRELMHPASNGSSILMLRKGELQRACADFSTEQVAARHLHPNPRLAQLLAIVSAELTAPGFASDLLIDGALTAIAALIARGDREDATSHSERIHITPARLARVAAFVEANLDHEITLADLAEAAQLSPHHFSRVFKRATGESPYSYVCGRRIERAMRLLAQDAMPLAEIALACGFSSQAHFTAAFTRAKAISPGRFRRHFKRR